MLLLSDDLARHVLDAAPDAMIIADSSGQVRYANRQASILFGHTHDQIVGSNVETLLPERLRVQHRRHRERYSEALRLRPMGVGLNLLGRRCDGSEFPVEISLSPIASGQEFLVAAAIRDVTERVQVEADLLAAKRTAERERQLADAARDAAGKARDLADAARDSADRANLAKSRFLATASHDLRQPLQTLALLNGTLRRMLRGDCDAVEVLSQEQQAITAMSRLLNALLDVSKLESGAIRPDPTDFKVSALFEELRGDFDVIARNKGLGLEIESSEVYVHSDRSLVQQILRNLISNALKYTSEGCVQLRCRHETACVRIQVIDSGIGIPSDQLPYIFDEFHRIDASTRNSRDGYGLGLSIVQRIVKLLELELDVTSEAGKGSTFSLGLPPGRAAGALD